MYNFFNPNPRNKDVGDCVVRAIACVTGQSWYRVYMGLCVTGYELCDMPTSNEVWGEYLKALGFRRRTVENTFTVDDIVDGHEGKCLLSTGSHLIACIDDNFYDTWDSGKEIVKYIWIPPKEVF